jgi:hypothetical protein
LFIPTIIRKGNSEEIGTAVTLWAYIPEAFDSNPGQYIGYPY